MPNLSFRSEAEVGRAFLSATAEPHARARSRVAVRKLLMVIVAALLPVAASFAENPERDPKNPIQVEYDHFGKNVDILVRRTVPDWGSLHVKVFNTCPLFGATATPVRKEDTGAKERGVPPLLPPKIQDLRKEIMRLLKADCEVTGEGILLDQDFIHDPAYGGYIIDVEAKTSPTRAVKFAEGASEVDLQKAKEWINGNKDTSPEVISGELSKILEVKDLKNVRIVISLGKSWNHELAGGFTVSELTNPKFAVAGTPAVVRRESANEDTASVGLAAFVHTSHADHPRQAFSLGLGLGDFSDLSLYVGYSWRLGGKTFLTWGGNMAKVDALPNGVREGDAVSDPNVLNNLQQRYDAGLFMGISYSFLGSPEVTLQKPFQVIGGDGISSVAK